MMEKVVAHLGVSALERCNADIKSAATTVPPLKGGKLSLSLRERVRVRSLVIFKINS
jgi:hypothetical protein